MWFLATRNRAESCKELVAKFKEIGAIPPVAVMIDDDPAKYADVRWPGHWDIHVAPEHLEMTRAHNTLLGMYPGEKIYGWFGDHFRPKTRMWTALAQAADDWFMAWPYGEIAHTELEGAPTFGHKLIETIGWINLPTTVHVATERPFTWLWQKLGIVRVLEREKFARVWPQGKGTVPRLYKGQDYNKADTLAYIDWRDNEAPALIERIRNGMIADGYEFRDNGLIHPKHSCTSIGMGDWTFNERVI